MFTINELKQKTDIASLSVDEMKNTKGGRRYVTSSYSDFERKRSKLQGSGACMCITHIGSDYCIEW